MRSVFLFLLITLLAVALAGCAAAPTPAAAAPAAADAATALVQRATNTPLPTQTPLPTATATPTATPLPTETPLPTPDPALSEVVLKGMGWLEDYNLFLTFDFPDTVDPRDYRVTLEDKEYECQQVTQRPNRLYCWGQGARVMTTATIRVYPAGSGEAGFEKELWIPFFSNSYNWPND